MSTRGDLLPQLAGELQVSVAQAGLTITVFAVPALTVSAFNASIAAGSWMAGLALESSLGATGPAVVGTVIAAPDPDPATALAVTQRRRSAAV